MSEYKEQNYWPGFVDALSNVVLTLVFVLVVFVFALVLSSDKLRKRASELSESVKQEEVARQEALSEKEGLKQEQREVLAQLQLAQDKVRELEQNAAQLKRQLAQAREQHDTEVRSEPQASLIKDRTEIKVVAPAPDQVKGYADLSRDNGAIVLLFPRNVFQLDDKAKAALDAVLDGQGDKLKGALSAVLSLTGAETYTEARRLAYFRGLVVRNYLIDKGLGDGRTIHVMIETGKESPDGRVEIRFRRP